ncbi:hypothetical protein B0T14DRAFT_435910 [Immersiella caudata]|uniref:Delta(24)-sterol reductase n=1 Tax=Immersiella caudata TaxID=314043 RepID=A0AA39WK88_9PEZI|nr:hypothetical protein B0T14DRAFT_435910 [Immersiella caudata]
MDAHHAAAEAVAARIRQLFKTQTPFRVYHGSTNSTRRSQRRLDNTVDTSGLNRVLHVDTTAKTALVEPNVAMDALVEATLAHGLVPLVVMEFPGITVGGGFSGTSGESSSFRHGSFDSTINWIEIVLPNGDIARASKTEKPDLFWGAASAFGTLGVVTLLEVQLRDAKQYVELSYRHIKDFNDVVETLQEETADGTPNDYVDAITFSLSSTIVCSGRLVDTLPPSTTPQHFLRARDPWFSVHAQRIEKRLLASPSTTHTDYVPIRDYLFRYDRGAFWTGRYAFRYFLTPFNRITRFLLNPFMHTRVMYRALHQSGLSDYYVVQDVGVPYSHATDLAVWLHQNLSVYPLWLCPLRTRREGGASAHHGLHAEFADAERTPDALLNFGVWGPASFNRRECVRKNRDLEAAVQRLGGKKWLYAQAFYTEDEFWAHYDREAYDTLRETYHAGHLPSVYDKVKVDVDAEEAAARASWAAWMVVMLWRVWPLAGLYGVYKAVVGGDYLLQKKRVEPLVGGKEGKKRV